jgi:hypothetical protein
VLATPANKPNHSLKKNNQTELFEDNQRDLERAVENLGYLLEQNPEPSSITKLRTDITNASVGRNCSSPTRYSLLIRSIRHTSRVDMRSCSTTH